MDSRRKRSFGPLPVFENVTPGDLAQVVSEYRAWAKAGPAYTHVPHPVSDFAVISDKGIEDLVRNCYLASLQPEEGRYPRFLAVVSGRRPPELVIRFTPPIPLTSPNVLRKLAPAVASDFAVSVREEAAGLHCEGIAVNLWEKNFLFDPPRKMPLSNGLCIRVEAPGEITIAEEHLTYHTRGGRGWPEVDFGLAPGVYKWLCELTAWVGKRLSNPEACGFSDADLHGVVSNGLVDILWARILHMAQNLRHGGAFVIRPTGDVDGIEIKRPTTGLHLGEVLVGHLNGVVKEPGVLSSGRYSLLTRATSLAHLSTVDGCVVLDRSLQLQGFAGHIQVDDECLRNQSRAFTNEMGELRSQEDLKALGARHNSAFRICKAYPHQLVFVISQDGDMRLFSSDEKHVYESRISANPGSLLCW